MSDSVTSFALRIAEESTYGTQGTYDRGLQLNGSTYDPVYTVVAESALGYPTKPPGPRVNFISSIRAAFDIQVHLAFNDANMTMVKHALGSSGTTGSGPYAHTLTRAEPGEVGLSLDFYTPAASEEILGCKVNGFRWEIVQAAWVVATYSIIGQAPQARDASPSTPSLPTSKALVNGNQCGQFTWNSANYTARRMVLTYSRNLDQVQDLGSAQIAEPILSGDPVITLEVELDETNEALHVARAAKTSSDLTFSITGSGNNSIDVTLGNAVITAFADVPSALGRRVIRATFTAFLDASDNGLTVVFNNDESSVDSNGPS